VRIIAIPVKSLSKAKTRLAPALSPLERGALTLAMLEDVLDAALAVPGWETWVVSPDEVVLEIAAHRGARAVPEVRPGLATAIRQAETLSVDEGAVALAVLPGDLPTLTTRALTAALHTLGPVVLARSRRDGTGLLLRRPPKAIPARFGPESYRKHLELAGLKGLPVATLDVAELGFDIDVPSDILTLLDGRAPGRTRDVCREMDLAERLAVTA